MRVWRSRRTTTACSGGLLRCCWAPSPRFSSWLCWTSGPRPSEAEPWSSRADHRAAVNERPAQNECGGVGIGFGVRAILLAFADGGCLLPRRTPQTGEQRSHVGRTHALLGGPGLEGVHHEAGKQPGPRLLTGGGFVKKIDGRH